VTHIRLAYLVLAHENPHHLRRLIAALHSPGASFIIHVDAKSAMSDFEEVRNSPGVHLCSKRIPVYWGDFSQVEAILLLLRESVRRQGFDRYVLLSGSDYPVQPPSYVYTFFARHPDIEFINCVAMPNVAVGKAMSRLTTFRHRDTDSPARRLLRRGLVMARMLPRERDPVTGLHGLKPYAGSTWWAVTHRAVEHILDFTDAQPDIVRFFHNVVCADESYFQTVLGNSPLRTRFRRNVTYADWSGGGSSPAYIGAKHLARFREPGPLLQHDGYGRGEYLLARKFSDSRADVVDELDRILRGR
jgi:hypothetical protein